MGDEPQRNGHELIKYRIEQAEERIERLIEKVAKHETRIELLWQKSLGWGAFGGALAVLIGLAMKMLGKV